MLVGLVHPDPLRRARSRRELPERLRSMASGDLLQLAYALAPIIDHRAGSVLGRRQAMLGELPKISVPILAGPWPLLKGWPNALEAFLADKINHNAKARGDGNCGASVKLMSIARTAKLPHDARALFSEFVERCRQARLRTH